MKTILISILVLLLSSPAQAGARGLHLALGAMALTNSSEQGGEGPSGSTILTQTDFFYNWGSYGFGAFVQWDKQGANENDLSLGPKIELGAGPFYIEAGYAVMAQRSFTDRSIEKQTGKGWAFGIGVRVPLSGQGGSAQAASGAFLQFSYKYRIQKIEKQDDAELADPITQKDGYPLFGIGYVF
jgi:hypothetical protein